ncbi:uncharacterized protein LOC141857684 [Brevipalpus obovatus]|uniref:uncharacterized protein LOC141857684 n=1 Tax=Brevipalpus obovatus TaxID=246614 RepID=UPI003D9F4C3A
MTSGALDSLVSRTRSSTHRKVPDRSSGQSSSLLCRCGSGGALLPPSSSPPGFNPVSSCFTRGAQSLPSTPNTNRRLISPSPRLDRTSRANIAPERKKQDHSIPPPPPSGQLPILPPPIPGLPRAVDPCHTGYGMTGSTIERGPLGMGENTALNPGLGVDNEGRSIGSRARTLNQVWSQQRRAIRYRASSSQPLMKASSLVIGLIAALVIGFIVLSPLFHILLP